MPFLGQASIVIDQATLPPGVAGRSRTDGVVGQVVTLRNADNTNVVVGGHRWVLRTPRASAATLSSPTSPTCTFTPDVDGTYLVELYVNEGQKPNQKARALLGVPSVGGFRYPAQGEAAEANWTSAYTGNPNETGWWESMDEILRSGQASIDGSHVTVIAEAGLPNSRRLQIGSGLSLVDGGPGGDITLDTAFAAGTKRLADVALQPENIISARAVQPSTRDNTNHGQVNLGSESVAGKGTKDDYATIGGGLDNLADGASATIAGGSSNTASADSATIAGGTGNEASAFGSSIGGGDSNTASASCSTVAGGNGNTASAQESVVAGGSLNTASGLRSGAVSGAGNTASGARAFVGAGNGNGVSGDDGACVGGVTNSVGGAQGFIGGGDGNSIGVVSNAVICGGTDNSVSDDATFIGGGETNSAAGPHAVCVGGTNNASSGSASAVGGGSGNTASGDYSTIAGGFGNSASGNYSSALGQSSSASAANTHAIGYGAQASHSGAIVLKDGAATTQASSTTNEITLRGDGGIRFIANGARVTHRLGSSTNNYSERLQGQQSTTDATAQTVNIASPASGADVTVRGTLKGKQNSSANGRSLAFWATYTNNGGAVAIVGSAHLNDVKGAPAWSLAVGISGTNIQLQFTGAAATTIRWTWDFEVHYGGRT